MPSDALTAAELDRIVDRVVQRGYQLRARRRILRGGSLLLAVLLVAGVALSLRETTHAERVHTISPGPGQVPVTTPAPTPYPGGGASRSPTAGTPGAVGGVTRRLPFSAGTAGGRPNATSPAVGVASATPSRIAFAGADGNIYVVNADGSAKRSLGAGLDPTWSPNGSQIGFWRGTGNTSGCDNDPGGGQTHNDVCTADVWVMNADGSHAHLLISNAMKLSWSPDGHHIAYSSDQPTANGEHDLYVANVDGSGARRLTSGFSDTGATWSPDGRSIIFGRCCITIGTSSTAELYEIGADGTNLHSVWGSVDIGASEPAWGPDGRHVAYSGYDYGANKISIWILDLATGTGNQLTQGPSGTTYVQNMDYAPAWSPDGRRIAYTHDPDGATGSGGCDAGPTTGCAVGGSQPGVIYFINPDGSGQTRLTDGARPSFQPHTTP